MLNKEEKEAIERLTFYRDQIKEELYPRIDYEEEKAISIVLNLLERQQKEIQRLEKDNDTLSKLVIVNEDKVIKELDLISKDKIRDILKDLDEFDTTFFNANSLKEAIKNSLNELLEEN